jgi:hypothetical protein
MLEEGVPFVPYAKHISQSEFYCSKEMKHPVKLFPVDMFFFSRKKRPKNRLELVTT